MTIADNVIAGYLDSLFGRSTPGDILHHLYVAVAPPGRGPLGVVDPDTLQLFVYAIAPDASVDTDDFIAKAIVSARMEAYKAGLVIHFAGLALESHRTSIPKGDEVAENRARRLKADRKLHEHPNAVEVTRLYAACSDGRRWTGQHILTGPTAGTKLGPDLHVGGLHPNERAHPFGRLVRALVSGGAP